MLMKSHFLRETHGKFQEASHVPPQTAAEEQHCSCLKAVDAEEFFEENPGCGETP